MKEIARVIITFNCKRNCVYCCNKYGRIMAGAKKIRLPQLAGFREICITGGEPMLNPNRTLKLIAQMKRTSPRSTYYLYTALFHKKLSQVIREIDGVHFTLHESSNQKDIRDFQSFQEMIREFTEQNPQIKKSFRLYINPKISFPITIFPYLWTRIESKPWFTEEELLAKQPNGLPNKEQLFILTESGDNPLHQK